MRKSDVDKVMHGLYKIFWKSGGHSFASVGSNGSGDRWFSPTNWISVPSFDWTDVQNLEKVDSVFCHPRYDDE